MLWFMDAFAVTFIVIVWCFMFFLFDNVILGGVISKKLKRWAESKFDEGSTNSSSN